MALEETPSAFEVRCTSIASMAKAEVDGGEWRELSVLEVEDALQALERFDARLARVVQLRIFGGVTVDEVAVVEDVSPATVKRDWTYARAWLFERMSSDRDPSA